MEKWAIVVVCLCALLSQVAGLRKYRSEEDIKFRYRRAFSDDHDRRFGDDAKNMIVDLHNFYRSNVTPPAADMKLLVWDDELEHLAQIWADHCTFEHGKPRSTYSKGVYGQKIYIGPDRTGYTATRMWFGHGDQYDVRTRTCRAAGGCSYYMQVAWSRSSRIGCGVTKCDTRYIIVCNYFESAIYGQHMYAVGVPCSQCTDENEILCWNNLCISRDQCERNRTFCEQEASCNLECHNCGRLDTLSCQCACPDGWDSRDCSRPCQDEHERCRRSPGFPNNSSCRLSDNKVRDVYCRQMCGQCNPVSEESWNKCCAGKVCEEGYVLNTSTCLCKKLCPGPLCDEYESEEEIPTEETDLMRRKELQLIEKEELLNRKEKILEEKENNLKQMELYLKEKEKFLKKQETLLQIEIDQL
ncbi:Peptidase inhibitor 16 [Araneus ventricosus]|uniref:Peptidase inhibitor 16 n=1 Tax=Araneus ventricosus TaxID=182803 RepID=A0A4Y2AC19_ARAVE|nr:Peptidase inhibitor 16 [Araneus ventricosus]